MFKKIVCLIFVLKLTQARYDFVPKFYALDSAIIVDAGKTFAPNNNAANKFANKLRMPAPFPLWRHYARYHIIPPPAPQAGKILSINTWPRIAKPFTASSDTSTSTTSTTTLKPTVSKSTYYSSLSTEEFPAELLDIAQNKLGLKSMDEIPSISEFGQLLGTQSAEETLKCIKQLTSNDQGIALMKAYIESADYTDNTADLNNRSDHFENEQKKEEDDDNEIDEIEEPLEVKDEGLIVIEDADSNDDYELNSEKEELTELNEKPKNLQKPTELPENNIGLSERLANYMHENNIIYKQEQDEDIEDKDYPKLDSIAENGKKVSKEKQEKNSELIQENQTEYKVTKDMEINNNNLKYSILPYNYPVPIRMQTSTTTTTLSPLSNTAAVHLNTPKIFIPHVQQLSRATKIAPKTIEDFLAGKPKLLELATKVSRFPVSYDRNSPIEAQIFAAVQKAFEQDEDLKTLLSSTATLK